MRFADLPSPSSSDTETLTGGFPRVLGTVKVKGRDLRTPWKKTPNPKSAADLGTSSQGERCANHARLEMRRMVSLLAEEARV